MWNMLIFSMTFTTATNMSCPEIATWLATTFTVPELKDNNSGFSCDLTYKDGGFELTASEEISHSLMIHISDDAIVQKEAAEAEKYRQSHLQQPKL